MSLGITGRFIILTAVGAAIFAVVEAWVDAHYHPGATDSNFGNGTNTKLQSSGSSWTNTGNVGDLDMEPQSVVYSGPGSQSKRMSQNGSIFAKLFHPGGNHNSQVNYEQSYAIQTSTKNPFANGTNNSYQMAVDNATSDPTNNVNPLVLGPGVAINNGS
jgi:hypothetical protein